MMMLMMPVRMISLLIFPSAFFGYLASSASLDAPAWWREMTSFLNINFQMGEYPYIVIEIILIYFFSYFWTTVVFSPEDMAQQLRENGSFIPGLRPGPRTAEYLETVVERITYVGAGFLALIAVIPELVSTYMNIPLMVSSFLGGTGLLIVVSVGLDLLQRIEANLVMRNYSGFMSTAEAGRGGQRCRVVVRVQGRKRNLAPTPKSGVGPIIAISFSRSQGPFGSPTIHHVGAYVLHSRYKGDTLTECLEK